MFYFIFGSDTFSIKQKIASLIAKFQKEAIGLNIAKIDGSQMTQAQYLNSVMEVSLFAEKKLVLIANVFDNKNNDFKKNLPDLIAKIPETTTVIFTQEGMPDKRSALFKKLTVPGRFVDFSSDDVNKTQRFIDQKLQAENFQIDIDAKRALMSSNVDLWFLENALEKLILIKKSQHNNHLTLRDIEESIMIENEPKMFQLTEAISQRKVSAALKVFHHLLRLGNNEIMLFSMIGNQQRKLLIISDLLSQGKKPAEIASKMKSHPFVVTKMIELLRKYPYKKIVSDFFLIQETDVKIKTGQGEPITLIDLLITKLAV